jgi:hypothetical protein
MISNTIVILEFRYCPSFSGATDTCRPLPIFYGLDGCGKTDIVKQVIDKVYHSRGTSACKVRFHRDFCVSLLQALFFVCFFEKV